MVSLHLAESVDVIHPVRRVRTSLDDSIKLSMSLRLPTSIITWCKIELCIYVSAFRDLNEQGQDLNPGCLDLNLTARPKHLYLNVHDPSYLPLQQKNVSIFSKVGFCLTFGSKI